MRESQTHCRHGHEFTAANTRFDRNGRRHCRMCNYLRVAAHVAKNPPPAKPSKTKPLPPGLVLTGCCMRGHLRSAENTYVSPIGTLVCRECRRAFDNSSSRPVTAEKLRKIFALLHEGRPLCEAYGKKKNVYVGNKIVESSALTRFMQDNPRIGDRIRKLAKQNVYATMQAVADRKRLIAAPAILSNQGHDAFEAIMRATANLWEGDRGDVMSLMFVAIAEGRLLPRDAAARLPEFVKLHRYRPRVYGDRSLDAPLYDDSSLTLGDTITRGVWQ